MLHIEIENIAFAELIRPNNNVQLYEITQNQRTEIKWKNKCQSNFIICVTERLKQSH